MLQYSDIFFALVGIFYPFVPILFLLFLLPIDALCGKGTLNTGLPSVTPSGAGNGPKSIEPCPWGKVGDRRLIRNSLHKDGRQSSAAQPFSDFDVQLDRSPDASKVRISAKSLTLDAYRALS
jgi:hypothetical protein